MTIETLSPLPLQQQVAIDAPTWLDRQLTREVAHDTAITGFGRDVRRADGAAPAVADRTGADAARRRRRRQLPQGPRRLAPPRRGRARRRATEPGTWPAVHRDRTRSSDRGRLQTPYRPRQRPLRADRALARVLARAVAAGTRDAARPLRLGPRSRRLDQLDARSRARRAVDLGETEARPARRRALANPRAHLADNAANRRCTIIEPRTRGAR